MDIIEDFRRRLQDAVFKENLIPDDKASVAKLCMAIEDQIRMEYQGGRVYITQMIERRNQQIRREHKNGERVAYLARRYNLSRRAIYKILNG